MMWNNNTNTNDIAYYRTLFNTDTTKERFIILLIVIWCMLLIKDSTLYNTYMLKEKIIKSRLYNFGVWS